jgi:hypothetical protein
MFHPTFQSIAHDESTAVRCIELVERYAAYFMRTGGGRLAQEYAGGGRRLTDAHRAAIKRDLAASNGEYQYRIAKKRGVAQGTVCKIWQKMNAGA